MMLSNLSHKLYRLCQILENPYTIPLWVNRIDVDSFMVLRRSRILDRFAINTFIDIGAHKGRFSLMIKKLRPNVRIYAFEPLLTSYRELERRAAILQPIKLYNLALGSEAGEFSFFVNHSSSSSSLLRLASGATTLFPSFSEKDSLKVRAERLDDILADERLNENVLVKVDVQGFEDRVLRGGKTILGKSKLVIVESLFEKIYVSQCQFHNIYEILSSLGFTYKGDLQSHKQNGICLFEDSLWIKE